MVKKNIDLDLLEPRDWFLKRSETEEIGPLNETALRQLLAVESLNENYLVRQGDSPYFPASDVRQLLDSLDEAGWYVLDQGVQYGPFMPKKVRALFDVGLFNPKVALIRQGAEGAWSTFAMELANSRRRLRQNVGDEATKLESAVGPGEPTGVKKESPVISGFCNSGDTEAISPTSVEPTKETDFIGQATHSQTFVDKTPSEGEDDVQIASYLIARDQLDRLDRARQVEAGEDIYRAEASLQEDIKEMQDIGVSSIVKRDATPSVREVDHVRSFATSSDPSTQFCPKCGVEFPLTDKRCESCFRMAKDKIRRNASGANGLPFRFELSGIASLQGVGFKAKVALCAAFAASGYLLSCWFTDEVAYRNYAGNRGFIETWIPLILGLALVGVAGLVLQFDPRLRDRPKNQLVYTSCFLVVAVINYTIKKTEYREADARISEQQEMWMQAMEGGAYQINPENE